MRRQPTPGRPAWLDQWSRQLTRQAGWVEQAADLAAALDGVGSNGKQRSRLRKA